MTEYTRYENWRAEQAKDPEVQVALEELEHAYLVARLRIERGLTQQQLADILGTRQASIARLESGRTQPRLGFLRRVIKALGARLELRVIRNEEAKRYLNVSVFTEPSIRMADEIVRLSKQEQPIYAGAWHTLTKTDSPGTRAVL